MTEQYIRYAAMFIIIMMAVIDDYRRFKVSNRIIIAGMVIGVVINMGSLMYGGDVRGYIYGGMAGFAIMYMVYIFGGVGAGDVKLLAVCGLLIGVTYIVRLICAAMVCGVLTGVLENVGVIKGRQGVCMRNQRIIAGNAQFTGIAAGRGVGFTTGLLLLRKGLGMRETPIRPHSWHCRMQSGYQYGGNRKRPPVWRRHRGSLRPRGRNLGGVEGMTGGCGSGCDPAIHTRRLRVYHRPRRLRMASRISIFFAARRFEPLNSMG